MNSSFLRVFPPVLFCALLWGSAFPAIKIVYGHWKEQGLEIALPLIFFFAGVRFTLAGLSLLVLSKGGVEQVKKTPKWPLIGFVLGQTFIQYIFFYAGLAVSSASLSALMVATGSFWWVILAPFILKTAQPKLIQWVALSIGAIGVCLAVAAPGAGAGNPVLGALLLMTATFSGALAIILFQKVRKTMGGRLATGLSQFLGGFGLLLLGIQAWPQAVFMFDLKVVLMTIYLASVSAVAFVIWNHLSTIHPVPLLATYRFLIPLCGVIEALVFLPDETAGWGLIVGGCLILVALVLAQNSGRNTKEAT